MTNGLLSFDAPSATLTMSSREIADLVESRHDSVKRTIERIAERGLITLPPAVEVSNDGPGPRTIIEYRLGKRDSLVIVAQLSPEFTARLVDRWQELEAQVAKPFSIPKTLTEALRLAVDLEEQRVALAIANEAKAKLIQQQKPAVDFAEAVQASDQTITVGQLAKLLCKLGVDTGERRLRNRLKLDGYLMEHGEPYQQYMRYFEVSIHRWETPSGRLDVKFSARITPEGEKYFMKRYAPSKPAAVAKASNAMGGFAKALVRRAVSE